MKTTLLSCVLALFCAGCVTTAPLPYDPQKDVSPIKVSKSYRTVALDESKLPVDSALAMAGIVSLIRGEAPQVDGLTIAPGIKLTEPGVPLENFNFVNLTILDRMESEVVKGKTWGTKTMAVLTFEMGPFRALVLTEATTSTSANGVVLEKASVRSLSPAQPRVAAWFVPKKAFQAAIAGNNAIPIWDLMELANSIGIPVGANRPPANETYQAVAFVLDRLEPGDTVKGTINSSLVPESSWWSGVPANAGIGFPVVMADVGGPLNVPAQEKYLHITWRPANASRTGGKAIDVPIGRFSTCGTVLKTAATTSPAPAESAAAAPRLLDLKNKEDALSVQRRLAQLGFFSGTADGAFGAISRASLLKFKKAKKLGDNSNWDLPTQKALFSETEK